MELEERRYIVKNNFLKKQDVMSRLMVGNNPDNPDVFISFFIPTFDRIDALMEAVESILNLKMLEKVIYEIIVVDNSANFSELNKNYLYFKKLNHPTIRYYINEENIGLFNNWNRGIELARGKYFAMLHDDDLLHPGYLVEMLKCLNNANKKGNFGFIHVKKTTFYSSNEIPPITIKGRGGLKEYKLIDHVLDGVGPTCAPTCGTIFSRKVLIESGGYDDFLYPSADQIMGSVIIEKGYRGYLTEDTLGYYRVGLNESLKPGTITDVVKIDYYISNNYVYKINLFTKIFGVFFSNIQYSSRVDLWVSLAENKYRVDLNIEDLDFRKSYGIYKVRKPLLRIMIILKNKSKKTIHQ